MSIITVNIKLIRNYKIQILLRCPFRFGVKVVGNQNRSHMPLDFLKHTHHGFCVYTLAVNKKEISIYSTVIMKEFFIEYKEGIKTGKIYST